MSYVELTNGIHQVTDIVAVGGALKNRFLFVYRCTSQKLPAKSSTVHPTVPIGFTPPSDVLEEMSMGIKSDQAGLWGYSIGNL